MIRRSFAAPADHCFMTCISANVRLGPRGSSAPGTMKVFAGFYTVRFQLGEAVGRSVMYVGDGKLLGGNSAFAHIGTYEDLREEIAIVVSTVRHNPDLSYK